MSLAAARTARRVLLLSGEATLAEAVAGALPEARLHAVGDPFAALAELADRGCDAVLAPMQSAGADQRALLAALRKACPSARLTLVCPPSREPEALAACRDQADDYVLLPIDGAELRAALASGAGGAARSSPPAMFDSVVAGDPRPAVLGEVASLLSVNGAGLEAVLQRAVETVAAQVGAADAAMLSLNARGETEQWVCTAALSAAGEEPVEHEIALAQALLDGQQVVGWLNLGPPRGAAAYGPAQVELLAQWGRLLGRIIATHRQMGHLQRLAVTDDLSGLYNRRYFDHFLGRIVRRAAAERFRVTVMIFDIDDFKQYNDRYGHMVGDAIIRDVAMLMRRCTRPHDVIARFGGDEFAVIFWDNEEPRQPNSQHPHDALALAERFREEMSRHEFEAIGPQAKGRLTISGGLASFPWDGAEAAVLLQKADEALLAAKAEGKDRILLVGK